MATTLNRVDLEIINGSTEIPLMFARPLADDGITPIAKGPLNIEEALVASNADAPLAEWLEPRVQEGWSGGFGGDYSHAAGLDTFSSPGYVLPAGVSTELVVNATQNSASPLVQIIEFGDDLWVLQKGTGTANSGRVLHADAGTGVLSNAKNLGANRYVRDAVVADDGAGTKVLWVSSSDVSGLNGQLHKCVDATAPTVWVDYAVYGAGNGRNSMRVPFWVDNEGVGADRIVTASGPQGQIAYLKPYADPGLAASWVEGVRTNATGIVNFAAARGHVWIRDPANVFDLNELGDTRPLLAESTRFYGTDTNVCEYMDDYVYYSTAAGLARVFVGDGAVLQNDPGICTPGYLTRTKSIYATMYVTALLPYGGGIFCAGYAPLAGVPVVFWGKPKRPGSYDPDKENALTWHGPFVVGSEASVITKMYAQTLATAPSQTRLLLASWNTSTLATPKLAWISMPAVGGAVAGIVGSSAHRFALGSGAPLYNATCRLELLPDTAADKASTQDLYQITYGTEGMPASSPGVTDPSLTVYTRADPLPSSTSWGTGQNVTLGPTQAITPITTRGNKIEHRIDFISPNGASTPPKPAILDSIRVERWRTAPDLDTWTFWCEFGDGVYTRTGGLLNNADRDVTWYRDALKAACRAGRITMRDRHDRVWSIKVKHALVKTAGQGEGTYGETVRVRLTAAILGAG